MTEPTDPQQPYSPPQYDAPTYPAPTPQPYAQPYGAPYVQAGAKKNGMGVASLVLGILAVLSGFLVVGGLLGILAIVFGVVGRGRAKRGEADNGGLAIAGIVLGIIGTLIAGAVLAYAISHREEISDYSNCILDANGDRAAEMACEERFRDQLLG